MTKDEALKMAIEAVEFEGVRDSEDYWLMMDKVRTACKEALATNEDSLSVQPTIKKSLNVQPTQEPVAHIKQGYDGYPKLVFNERFEYVSIAAKWDDIALYTKEQL